MKNIKKIVILTMILTIVFVNGFTFATGINPNEYKPGKLEDKDSNKVGKITGNILATVKVVGVCISVIILTVIGLKYILSAADEKANYKENMVPYVVGCFLLASATVIPSLVYDLMK